MKAALMREYHRPLELVELPAPQIARPTDVLVRVGGAGVCATDLHAIEGLMEPAGVTLPLVLGHENAGWVDATGDGVSTVAAGDAVLVYPPFSCGLWELLQLQAAGRLTLKTEMHPLEAVNDVLDKLRDGEVTGRAVLVPRCY